MQRRSVAVAIISISILLAGASPASALTKVRSPLTLFDDPVVFDGFCPFPVTYQDVAGSGTLTLVFDGEDLVRVDIHPHGVISTFTANGNVVTSNNSGPISVFPQADGTDRVFIRGSSYVADQGLIGGESFWLLTTGRVDVVSVFNPATGFNDFLEWSASAPQTDLCGLLAA